MWNRQLSRLVVGLCAAALVVIYGPGCFAAEGEKAPGVGDVAKDFELKSIGGEKIKLSKLTDKGQVILIVLRGYPGYQCPLCTKQVGELISKADDIKKAGARVLLVYPGPSEKLQERASEFVKGKDYPEHFQIVLDPDYSMVKAYGLRWDARNETAYPSTFVLNEKRTVKFATISRTHGGRPKTEDVLNALKGK